jgi:long-chain acyl-CoA synthetase
MTILVPAVLKMMVESPAIEHPDVSSLDIVAYAGSPITAELLRAVLGRFTCGFAQIYGMTETSGVTALLPEDHLDPDHPERLLSAGAALPGVSLRVVDPATGTDVEDGAYGEVWIKASTNMLGYWDLPAETEAALTPDGYVRSGDGGYLLDGYLYLKDRIKDMIVSGGENVYPIEVENVLIAHPGINDVSVIGVPSSRWGETVKAIVVREPSAEPVTATEVIACAKANLAGYKCPTSVEFVDELPRNATGKVLKRILRRQFGR